MKKKSFAIMVTLGIMLCLTACTESSNKNTDPIPDNSHKTVTEDTAKSNEDAETKTGSKSDEHTAKQEKTTSESEKSKDKIKDGNKATTEDTTATTTEVDPYAGLAVSNVHSVTVTKGTSYSDITDKIIDGCTSYPNTYPDINIVDNNKPGVYQCYWVRLMDDGTYLPLDYAGFTVTITE